MVYEDIETREVDSSAGLISDKRVLSGLLHLRSRSSQIGLYRSALLW